MQRELVTRAMGGDHEAFTSLVDASVGRLYAVANMILRDQDRAQDAVQEALVSAWRDLRSLRDPDAWDAWLYRLTVWACYRQARKDRRRTLVESHVMLDEGMEPSSDIALPDRRTGPARAAARPAAHRATRGHRGPLLPRPAAHRGGRDPRHPVGTAKARLYRGLQALRDAMSAEPEARLSPVPVRAS